VSTDNLIPFDRPPVVLSIDVATSRMRAFDVFVQDLGSWWPTHTFALAPGQVRTVTVDSTVGGSVTETRTDGTTAEWGRVLAWDPPDHFAMTWNQTGTPTEVRLSFRELSATATVVTLEHLGWERLTEAELARACALPGGYLGGAFRSGWERILGNYRDAADASGVES